MAESSSEKQAFADPVPGRVLRDTGLATLRRYAFAASLLLTVVYGSLIPFRIDLGRLRSPNLFETILQFRGTSFEDVAVNVVGYAILAATLLHSLKRWRTVEAVAVIAFCSALSLAVETLQALIPQRVSSATDVLLNTFGAALGVIGCRIMVASRQKVVQTVVRELRERPWGLAAIAISSALLAYDLVPFDFITDTQQLHDSFRRIQPLDLSGGLSTITHELAGACWFALLGFLMARESRSQRRPHLSAFRAGLQHGLFLAFLIECLQLFTRSHVPEPVVAAIRALAALFGAWTAVFLMDRPLVHVEAHNRTPISTSLLFAAAAIQLVFLAMNLLPAPHGVSTKSVTHGWSLPFQSLWLQPAPLAGARALSTIVTACLLAATLAAAFRRAGVPLFRVVSSLVVIGFYLAVQFLSANFSDRPIDVTNAILAVMACGFALRIERWLARLDGMSAATPPFDAY